MSLHLMRSQRCCGPASRIPVFNPPSTVVLTHEDLQVALSLTFAPLIPQALLASPPCFPVLSKPVQAHGSSRAHEMSLIRTPAALACLSPPALIQQCIRHEPVVFKVASPACCLLGGDRDRYLLWARSTWWSDGLHSTWTSRAAWSLCLSTAIPSRRPSPIPI
jgi:hypothetical protein